MIRLSLRRQAGFSFVEFSFAFVVLGVAALLLWKAVESRTHMTRHLESASLLERAQDALYAFARLNGRFPCAAISPEGIEDCKVNDGKGYLPFLTIGFPESTPIDYKVSAETPIVTEGMHFQVLMVDGFSIGVDRLSPEMRLLSSFSGAYSPDTSSLLDICASLMDQRVAETWVFELGATAEMNAMRDNENSRIWVSRAESAGALGCMNATASARTYFNTLLASNIIQRGATDGFDQFMKDYWVKEWDLALGTVSSFTSAFSFSKAGWLFNNAIVRAQIAFFYGPFAQAEQISQSAAQAYAEASAITASASVVTSISNLARFSMGVGVATLLKNEIEENKEYLSRLDVEIRRRAIQSAAQTYFLDQPIRADVLGE